MKDDETKAKLEEFKLLNLYVNTTSYSAIPSFKVFLSEFNFHFLIDSMFSFRLDEFFSFYPPIITTYLFSY